MAARQLWVFLTDQDVQFLVEKIAGQRCGLVESEGRYLKGPAGELVGDTTRLERKEALPNERRIYFFHPAYSQDIVAHEQPEGPFAGWSQIDEERSDCLVLRIPKAREDTLEPARLYANTSFWRAGDKIRKRPPFAVWANQTLRFLLTQLPSTSVRFMRAGPEARAKAISGELKLTYLFRTIAPLPLPSQGAPVEVPLPAGALTEESPEESLEDE